MEPVLEKQLTIVIKRLRKPDGGYYPVVLHLRNHNDQQTDVHADAIEVMEKVDMPKDYPIHCHYWTGCRTDYDNWTTHFPNTLFGFNAGSFSRGLSPDPLELLRMIPLGQVNWQAGTPGQFQPLDDGSTHTAVLYSRRLRRYLGLQGLLQCWNSQRIGSSHRAVEEQVSNRIPTA